jgi:hypothetical protein
VVDHDSAKAAHVKATSERTAAAADVQRVERAVFEGTPPVTEDDYETAIRRERFTNLAMKGTAQRLAAAERAVLSTDTSLAEAVVPFVESVLPGVTPVAVPFRPTTPPTTLPAAVITQSKPSRHDRRSGSLAGEVEVRYFRTRQHREIEAGDFEREAEQRAHAVSLTSATGYSESANDLYVDVIRLAVLGCLPDLPEVSISDALAVGQELGDEVAFRVRQATTYKVDHLPLTASDTGLRTGVQATASSPAVLSDVREGDVRRLTVEVVVTVSSHSTDPVARAVNGLSGARLPKAGKIEEVVIVATGGKDDEYGRPSYRTATVRAVVASKVPAVVEVAHQDDEDQDDYGRARDPRDADAIASHPGAL